MILFILSIIHSLSGFHGPDGLSAGSERVYMCCEGAGTVMSFDSAFSPRLECSGLNSPEGICTLPSGAFLVTEDSAPGRLLAVEEGVVSVVAMGLGCPEGVSAGPDGIIWFTTGGFQAGEPFTSLWNILDGEPQRVYSLPSFFSFSDLEAACDGTVYLCSESSGLLGNVSVFAYLRETGDLIPFASGIPSCEGICLTEGGFPMYAVSEDGLVFTVDSLGNTELLLELDGTAEDAVLFNGELLVSEDSSGSLVRTGILP